MPEYAVSDAAPAEDFQGLVLRFRGRSGLTQRQLAYRTGASPRSVQAWEAGISHPSTGSLQALITCFVEAGGFARGREAAEAEAIWAAAFARVYWRSVRNAPPMHDWLGGAIAFLSDHELLPPDGEMARLKVLLQLLRDQPCLLVLDNLEPLLQAGGHGGGYLEGFSGYGTLLRMLAEGEHQSCLVFTSREAPSELAELAGGRALRTLELGGLSVTEVQALLSDRHLRGGEPEWASLVTRYGGNGLALKVVAESVVQVFGGDIAAFLEQAGFG